MITLMNRIAARLRQTKYVGRLVNILTDYLWVRILYFWEFDLNRTDAPWRTPDDGAVRWGLATVDDCRQWKRNDVDGFSPDDCELLIQLIEQGNFVLAGFDNKNETNIPDCYAACAVGTKPMTQRCGFHMEPNEGTIRTVYTRIHSRGRGLATRIYAQLCRIASERGFGKLYVDIDSSNRPSFRAAEKAGAIRMKGTTVYELRFLKRSYVFVRGSLRNRFINT